MNKRQKLKRIKIGSTAKQRKKNKELCKRYPFLIPRNVWSDEIIWERLRNERKYGWTLVEEFPTGWWKAFGLMMCEELREDLIKYDYLDKFRFEEIKEKFGQLRVYYNGIPIESDVNNIIDKYSILSENICIKCGRPDVPMINITGWISPYCYHCFNKINKRRMALGYEKLDYEKCICNKKDTKMPNLFTWRHYSKDGSWDETIDISETADRIRNNWKGMI